MLACSLPYLLGCTAFSGSRRVQSDAARENAKLKEQLAASNDLIVKLTADVESQSVNIEFLEAELRRTRDVLEYAEAQFISLEKGLQSHETKASAVAALAEARLAYDKRLREDPKAARLSNVRQARERIEKSDELIPQRRFAAAVYFARRAVRLLHEAPPKRDFLIVSVNQANMRGGPGLAYGVVEQLTIGTVLIRMEKNSPWYKVKTRDGDAGWIHESVVVAR